MAESALAAIADAGLQLGDIDGLFAATSTHAFPTLSVAEYLGLRPRVQDGTNIGGSSFEAHLLSATMALAAGQCDAALICYGSNQRSAGGRLVSMSEKQVHEAPYKPRNPITAYALAASRHMHQFGTTREMLAEVAVAARAWANLNPAAFAHGPLTLGGRAGQPHGQRPADGARLLPGHRWRRRVRAGAAGPGARSAAPAGLCPGRGDGRVASRRSCACRISRSRPPPRAGRAPTPWPG